MRGEMHSAGLSLEGLARRVVRRPQAGGSLIVYTSSFIGAMSIRCCGRPVGSMRNERDGSMPRLWYSVANTSPKWTGRLLA